MPDILTLIVALLAAVGAVTLVWLILGGLLRLDCSCPPVIAVMRVPEGTADVQSAVRRLRWLSQWGAIDLRIVLTDGGMTDEAKKQADILLREDPGLLISSEAAGLLDLPRS